MRGLSVQPSARYVCRGCLKRLAQRQTRTYASAAQPDMYDVVCVGGGPAGLSLLTALRELKTFANFSSVNSAAPLLHVRALRTDQRNPVPGANPVTSHLRVALIEAQDLSKTRQWTLPPDQYSNRCSSLTPTSASFLHTIGAWRHLQRERVQPYQEMQVWDGVTGARIEFDWQQKTSARHDGTIAYMVENLNLTSGLLKRLEELKGNMLSVFDGSKVESITLGEDASGHEQGGANLSEWPVVRLATGQQLWARLLVGADGANSPVRTFAGIDAKGWDYNRHGVVASLQTEAPIEHDGQARVAYQRFLPTGPLAMLPLPGRQTTLVWSTTPERAARLKSLSPTDALAMINAGFRLSPPDLTYLHSLESGHAPEVAWRMQHTSFTPSKIPPLVTAIQPGTIASFPLKMRHADTYIGERVALVGDAAHTIHPLAGQGLNQGQGDVQSLVKTIEHAVAHGQDIGARMWLEPYNAERYAANNMLLGVCDKLHKLYSVEGGPLVAARSLGLSAVDKLGPLKRFFMEQAAGTGVRLL